MTSTPRPRRGVPRLIGPLLRRLALLLTTFLLGPVVGSTPAAAQSTETQTDPLVAVAGTHVAMEPPPGFVVSQRFSGFEHPDTYASILVVEMPPEAYEGVSTAFTAEALATRGMEKASDGTIEALAERNLLVQAQQTVGSLTVHKMLLLVEGGPVTVLINGNLPIQTERSGDRAAMLAAYRTLEIRDTVLEMALPFALGHLGSFEEQQRLAGQTVLYAEPTEPDPGTPPPPLFIVAPSLGNPPIDDVEEAARLLFKSIDAVQGQVVTSEKALTVAGLPGWEIIGAGADARTGAPTLLYQAFLVDHGQHRYFRLIGTAPLGAEERYTAEFQKMTRGFSLIHDAE